MYCWPWRGRLNHLPAYLLVPVIMSYHENIILRGVKLAAFKWRISAEETSLRDSVGRYGMSETFLP